MVCKAGLLTSVFRLMTVAGSPPARALPQHLSHCKAIRLLPGVLLRSSTDANGFLDRRILAARLLGCQGPHPVRMHSSS